jgi:hypothetical protein
VEIYRDSTLIFLGLLESRTPKYDSNGQSMLIGGRDYGAKLAYKIFPDTVFPTSELADVIRTLLRPTKEVSTYFDDFSGATFNFTKNRGTWMQQYGLVEALDDQAAEDMYATCDETGAASWTNYLVSAYICPFAKYNGNRLDWSVTACGVLGGFAAGPNYVAAYLGYDATDGKRKFFLSEVVAGVETVLQSVDLEWNYLNTYHIALQLQGTTAKAFIDGTQRLTGTIPAGYNVGKPGMIAGGAHCQFDNFFVSLTGKTATASLNSATAINAIDGNLDSKWSSGAAQANEQWFKKDLGASIADVCRITIIQDTTNFAKNWKIEVSTNDADYTQVSSKTGDCRPTLEAFFTAQTVRYIKVTITASDAAQWDIYEFGVSTKDGDQILEEGIIDNVGVPTTVKLSGEDRLSGCFRVAEIAGWNFWVGLDGKANFQETRGSDLSGTVKFRKGFEISSISRKRELDLANNITVLGQGEGEDQLFVTVKDQPSIDLYGQFDKIFIEQDLMSLGALNMRAAALRSVWKNPVDKITLDAIDPYASNAYDVGDQAQIVQADLELDAAYRIHEINRTFGQQSEEVHLVLADVDRLALPIAESSQIIDELGRSVSNLRNYPAGLEYRYDVQQVSGLQSVGSALPDRYS